MNKKFWPRFSIVTPSYNQGDYLEETILSVLEQNYPNLEFIIIDGGSTDNSIDILHKYDSNLSYWISEPDRGQTHAINKGLAQSTGEIWSYLNSDDLLCPGALKRVAEEFADPKADWVGGVSDIFEDGSSIGDVTPKLPSDRKEYLAPWNRAYKFIFPCSNVSFMRRVVLERCGFFDESYHYSMDIEYYTRAVFQGGFTPRYVPDVRGRWRWHSESKTFTKGIAYGFRHDEIRIAETYRSNLEPKEQRQLNDELKTQKRWLVVRQAMYELEQGQRWQSFKRLSTATGHQPSLLRFRPLYGALRRVMRASNE